MPLLNSGMLTVLQGVIALNNGFTPTGGSVQFGLGSATGFGQLAISGSTPLDGSLSVVWLNDFVPALSNSFALVNYGSSSGAFTNVTLPGAPVWQTNYSANSF